MTAPDRLKYHIEWLRGDHEECNPFLAKDIEDLMSLTATIPAPAQPSDEEYAAWLQGVEQENK